MQIRFDYQTRVKTGLALLIFFALLSNQRLLTAWAKFDLSHVGKDDTTLYQNRFDEIRKMLPAHGMVGYSGGGLNYAEYWKSDPTALRNWFLTQYTLAPVVVTLTSNHKLNIINGSAGESKPDSSADEGMTTRDLGNGMKLFDFGNGLRLMSSE